MRTALLLLLTTASAFVTAKPVVDVTSFLQPRQPTACPWYCILNGTIELAGETIAYLVDSPGCSDCPGHNCTGKAEGDLNLFPNLPLLEFKGDYLVRSRVLP